MVHNVNDWIVEKGYNGETAARGAYDAEPAWSTFSRANLNWMHGYDATNAGYTLLGNFSADGCPTGRTYNLTSNVACTSTTYGWYQSSLWHLQRYHWETLPFPQIYNSSMDRQWMRIEEYGNHVQNNGLTFWGVMAGAGTPYNTAHSGHQALWGELNQPSPSSAHSPNHAAQNIYYATLQTALSASLHDH